jgi:Mg-chelatase subunit ChlD
MERRHRLFTAAAIPAAAALAAVLFLGPSRARMQETPPAWAEPCSTGPQKWAEPTELGMGGTSRVTMVMTSTCPAYNLPVDVVFVVDRSNSMTKGQEGPGGIGTQGTPGGAIGTPGGPGGVDPIPTQKQPPPTKDPDPNPTGAPQAGIGLHRVRGLAQAPINPTKKSPLTLTPGSGGTVTPVKTQPGGVVPTGTAGLIIRRDVVEPPGDEDLIREVVQAIADFLDHNEEAINEGRLRVALVTFNDRARIDVDLNRGTNGAQRVRSALSRIRGEGNTRIDLGLSAALRVLHGVSYRGRSDLDYSKVAILFSDGKADARTTARLRLRNDITYVSVAVGRSANLNVMRNLASENEFFLDIRDRRELVDRVNGVPKNTRPLRLTLVTVRDKLMPNMEFQAGSANPPPDRILPDGTYEWDFLDPTGPVTVTYDVKPLAAGLLPVSEMAEASWTDTDARTASGPFPPVELNVGEVPTPASTNTPEIQATATSTLAVEITSKYFPAALNRDPACEPQQQTVDVALVIDTSLSMTEPTQPGGIVKLEAAARAGQALLDLLKVGDQVAIVAFNDDAQLLHGLSSDIAAVRASLDSLASYQSAGTKIDTGIAMGHAELVGPNHRARNSRALILVTDGQQDAGQNSAVIRAAELAQAAGITLWAVGLGQDADQDLLRLVASRAETFVFAPNAEDLELIYEDIARSIPCQ